MVRGHLSTPLGVLLEVPLTGVLVRAAHPHPVCTPRNQRTDRMPCKPQHPRSPRPWLLDQPTPMGRETVKLFAEDFRRFLWLLIPHVEELTSTRPQDDVSAQVALAGVGQARRRLAAIEDSGRFGEIERVKPLARSVLGLCDHFDALTGITGCLVCDQPIDHIQAWVPYDAVSHVISSGPGRVHTQCAGTEHHH
ncbi:DUF6415 family natural product biosynthesis protein [Streptomyces hyaluromycini]|uniref:DUF6415 family natural product biosynthesis protein n=1 Tax=Streptomyces hyaluromycini TaxID=1377993 RepID=A0ABV1WX62_9ACTN